MLADGEATFRRAESTAATSTGTGASATLTTIEFTSAPDGGAADSFVPGAGSHDVELLRDALASSETLVVEVDQVRSSTKTGMMRSVPFS